MKKIILLCFFISTFHLFANTETIEITISESLINNFLNVMGTIKGKNTIKILGSRQKYDWEIKNMSIQIEEQNINFKGDIDLYILGQKLCSPVIGIVGLSLDKENDIIKMKVEKLVPTEKSVENKIDLAAMYSPEFEYELPKLENNSYNLKMPNGDIKIIQMNIKDKELIIEKEKIKVKTIVEFSEIVEEKE